MAGRGKDTVCSSEFIPPHAKLIAYSRENAANSNGYLIDWDDAMALNWMADVSRLTLWMKQNYNEQEYALFRNIFLEHYHTSYRKAEFDVFENAYHIYSALDSLIFSMRVGNKEMEKRLKGYLDGIC